VELHRRDAGGSQRLAAARITQPGRTPHLVARGKRPRDRESDLAGRARDEDLLPVEHHAGHRNSCRAGDGSARMSLMPQLVGEPSDDVPQMLATGRSDVTTIYVSMTARHPDGRDADYLEWHSLDHRPEQHRLHALRAS